MAESIAEEAARLISDAGGLTPFIRDYGFGGILYAIFLAIIGTIDAAGDVILAPFQALAQVWPDSSTGRSERLLTCSEPERTRLLHPSRREQPHSSDRSHFRSRSVSLCSECSSLSSLSDDLSLVR